MRRAGSEAVVAPEVTAPDDRLLMDTYMSQYRMPALAAADRLGVFPLLDEEPRTAEDIARALGLDREGSTVLLALLGALGFLAVYEGRYHLMPASRAFLLPGADRYWGPMLGLGWDEKCSAVRQFVRDGTPHGYRGRGIWETHIHSARQGDLFTAAMHAHSAGPAAALAAQLDLAGVGTLLDVAGGAATFSVALARRHEHLRALVLDLPAVEAVATKLIERAGVTDRVRLHLRDMFAEPWPGGQDRILLADTLCDWGDDACRQMLASARDALAPGGRLLVHQVLLDDARTMSAAAAGYAMALAVMTGGRLRTLPELGLLLDEAGFTARRATALYGHYSLITAWRG